MDFETDRKPKTRSSAKSAPYAPTSPTSTWRDHGDRRAEFPHDFYAAAVAKAGYFLGVAIPEQYGGSGLGITEAALVMREISRLGRRDGRGQLGSSLDLRRGARWSFMAAKKQKRRYLPKVVSGEMHASHFAVTEPDAGNDITHIKTAARREGDSVTSSTGARSSPPKRARHPRCSC